MDIITVFDRPMPEEKQAEGIAVTWAVASGACRLCNHLPVCENDTSFVPPPLTFCMMYKHELLEKWKGGAK